MADWELRIIETGTRVGYAEDQENWPGLPGFEKYIGPADFRGWIIRERCEQDDNTPAWARR